MRVKMIPLGLMVLVVLAVGAAGVAAQGAAPAAPLGSAFTYQGRLLDGDQPASGSYDFEFYLFNAAAAGTSLGAVALEDVEVHAGLFTVQLDFGTAAFDGQARWLELRVRPGNSDGGYTLLSPRQPLTPAPFALWAGRAPWKGLAGMPAGFADGIDDDTTYSAGVGLALDGTVFRLAGSYRLPQGCGSGQIARWNGNAWVCAAANNHQHDATAIGTGTLDTARFSAYADLQAEGRLDNDDTGDLLTRQQGDGRYWKLTGNGGTSNANFLGTTSNRRLVVKVNNTTALQILPSGGTPNLIGGSSVNEATGGVVGGTIGGGGAAQFEGIPRPNRVTDSFATVGGGSWNQAGNDNDNLVDALSATVGGGFANEAAGYASIVGGGSGNSTSDSFTTVGGGAHNTATTNSATVAGGQGNDATGAYAAVGGGQNNNASSGHATVGGGDQNNAGGPSSTVSGGGHNEASGSVASVGGGADNSAGGAYATVSGGQTNSAGGAHAAIGGGLGNDASNTYATIPGGYDNTASRPFSFAAGRRARANHDGAFVWADSQNFDFASTANNQFTVRATGGFRFVTAINGSGSPTGVCTLSGNTPAWNCPSDRSLKANLTHVDGQAILQQVSRVPVFRWSARGGDPDITHIGPMAQDFYAAFGVGENDRSISTIDLDGVALAAIQGLNALAQEQEATITTQRDKIATLESENAVQNER
ncbi:MAG TPA: tail fiber domain-containing protein, partial [Ardenticatenaceae bacterium]|nr:tail fiber domain-containing protein [Ardenticatenaceae bacterium]